VRRFSAWNDSLHVADLLEIAFKEEIQLSQMQGDTQSEGQHMINALRTYGALYAMFSQTAPAFVWDENGHLLGNVSIQQNPLRKDTWVIGNVATHPDHRNRGISTALLQAAIEHALKDRRARYVALQVVDGNDPATHLYKKLGFETTGSVTRYHRSSVWAQPVQSLNEIIEGNKPIPKVRSARRSDRDFVWHVTRFNVSESLTYSEPFDERPYRLGWRWAFDNIFGGNCEKWFVCNGGAVRTRANFDIAEHHVELMLSESATLHDGIALLSEGLKRFEDYINKPLFSAQSHPHTQAHVALQLMGFKPRQTFLHMRLTLR
jgi:GNAT superfamily N-acetyltransferase